MKDKNDAMKRLLEYERNTEIIEPPFYKEIAGEIFSFSLDNPKRNKFTEEIK